MVKEYEFRSWKTSYRGKILIHSSLNMEKDVLSRFNSYNLNYINGAIIGEAYLTDCILVDKDLEKQLNNINSVVYGASKHTRKYAWKLEQIKKYQEPIYIQGRLGLWNYNEKNNHD